MKSRRPFSTFVFFSFFLCCIAEQIFAQDRLVGTIPGAFDVTLSGSSTYSIPIRMAPGAGGTEPKLAIVYDSQAAAGALGAGWSIVGMSVITRGPKSLFFDGVVDGVRLEESDALFLDGQKLIPIATSGGGAARRIEYRKEIDDQSRIVQFGADFTGSRFAVWTKGGLIIIFDGSGGSKVGFGAGPTLLQAASYIVDTAGNSIRFIYKNDGDGDYDIEQVRYTGRGRVDNEGRFTADQDGFAAVIFDYEAAARTVDLFIAGRQLSKKRRLKSIRSIVGPERSDPMPSWSQVARYELGYEERPTTANRFVLAQVRQFGEDDSEISPTKFSYSKPDFQWAPAPYNLPAGFSFARRRELAGAYRFVHFTAIATNVADLLVAAQVNGQLEAFAYQNKKNGLWDRVDGFKPPFAFTNTDGEDLGAVFLDLNGDGRVDLLQSHKTKDGSLQRSAYLADTDKWTSADQASLDYRLPFNVSVEGKRVATILQGVLGAGRKADLLYESEGQLGFLENSTTGWKAVDTLKPPVSLATFAKLLDVDCDGIPELVAIAKDSGGVPRWKVFRFTPSAWKEETRSAFSPEEFIPATTAPGAILDIWLTGQTCQGLIASVAGGVRAAIAPTTTGWKSVAAKAPPFDLVAADGESAGAIAGDLDNDGRADVIAHRAIEGKPPLKFAFRQSDAGWASAPEFEPAEPLSTNKPASPAVNAFVGDLDGDGFPEVVLPAGTESGLGRVFKGAASGFQAVPDFGPKVPFARADQEDRGARLLDLNGDGLPDIVFNREVSDPAKDLESKGAFVNTGRGWLASPGLTPPQPFASDHITGNPVQFADVDGDGYIDMLYSYRKADGSVVRGYYRNMACDPANAADAAICAPGRSWDPRFDRKWVLQEASPGVPSSLAPPDGFPFAAERDGDLGIRFADLNGDGRVDILVGFLPRKGSSGGDEPVDLCTTENNDPPVCKLNRGLFRVAAFLNDGTSWVRTVAYDPPLPFVTQPQGERTQDLFVQVIDVDGDRLPDIVAGFRHPYDANRDVLETWLNTGRGWRLDANLKLPLRPSGMQLFLDEPLRDRRALVQWADVNGDGLADIIFTKRVGASNESVTFLSTGRGFSNGGAAWQVQTGVIADREGDQGFRLVDVNGDGMMDIISARKVSGGTIEAGLLINNGTGWVAADSAIVANVPAFIDENGHDQGVRLFDVDGNGLLDVLRSFASGPGNTIPGDSAVLLNNGRRTDVLASIDAGFGVVTSINYQALLQATPSDGANVTSVAPWDAVYVPGLPATMPIVSPVPASYVVRRAVLGEGGGRSIAFSYRYGEYRVHGTAMRPLGFRWRESFNEAAESRRLTRTELLQDIKLRNSPVRESTCWIPPGTIPRPTALPGFARPGDAIWANLCPDSIPSELAYIRKLSETINSWSVKEGTVGGTNGLPTGTIRQIHLARSQTMTFELDRGLVAAQMSTFVQDDNVDILKRRQNVLETVTENLDGSSITTKNDYAQDDEAKWFFGRLTRSTVIRTGDVRPNSAERYTETKAAEFEYDVVTGLLKSEIANAHLPERAVRTDYRRDQYGNVILAQVSAPRQPTRFTRTEFDPLGRFAVAEVNPLGQRTAKTRRLTTGEPLVVVGLNGEQTRFEYDGLGRARKETSPSGVVSTVEMVLPETLSDPALVAGLNVAYVVRKRVDGMPPTLQLFDSKGRLLRSVSDGFTADAAAKRLIMRDTKYDLVGRPIATSLPYQQNETVRWAIAEYDPLGRLSKTIAPDMTENRSTYVSRAGGGWISTVTDPLGRQKSTEINTRRLPLSVKDAAGGTIRYEYDAGDRTIGMIGPTGAITRHRYDNAGQRVETNDPDMGVWKYEYDPFGRLVQQVDAKSQVTSLEYDLLGRLVRKSQSDLTAWWEYDGAAHGIGKVTSVRGSDGYREDYFYDEFSRQARWAVTIGNETFATTTQYDNYGRVARIYYPSALSVENVYDAKGFLVAVRNSRGARNYWSLSGMDQFGRITEESFGNGVITTREYETETGRPKRIQTQTQGAAAIPIIDLELAYDRIGNLTRRQETTGVLVPGRAIVETFEYDELDRLVGLAKPDGTRERYAFDAAGRITSKTGVGTYSYAPASAIAAAAIPGEDPTAKPFHAVLSTRLGGTSYTFGYDLNGNMVRSPTGTFEYTADNRMRLLFADQARWARFDYAPSGARYKQFARTGIDATETLYIGGYERVTSFVGPLSDARRGKLTRHRHYLANGEGVFAAIETNGEYSDVLIANPDPRLAGQSALIPRSLLETTKVWYLHKDQLGSVLKITDEAARVAAAYWHDPWGKRTASVRDPERGRLGERLAESWTRGFTGHEHLDTFSLIHMNGRVYNASTSLFTSSDPAELAVGDTQAIGRYRYAMGNPLRYIDPTGLWDLGGAIVGGIIGFVTGGPAGAAAGFILGGNDDTRRFIEQNWKTAVIIAATVAVTVATGGAGAGIGFAILAGMAGGATSGALSAILYGGSFDDVMGATIKGAVIGAFSGAIGYGVASAGLQGFQGYVAQGASSGLMHSMQGGNFGQGFLIGFATGAIANGASRFDVAKHSVVYRAAVGALSGGVASRIAGGKFENGAVTGAFAAILTHYARQAMMNEGRALTPGERSLAKKWFGDKVDGDRVRVINGTWNEYQDPRRAMAPNGNIYMGSAGCADYSDGGCGSTDVFVHEMTHVVQYQSGQSVLLEGAVLQFRYGALGQNVYEYQMPADFGKLNIEQQGQYMQDRYIDSIYLQNER
ncbi:MULTISPECIES: RHS repeat-associated core domain-containing protein [unclassified Bradyrhizobium]|uniref:RHS repeat-associated core domain-containing protein n=1 Tax=unclassified Bradyrhizobium TaxID=2631580 RepID=UPI002916C6BA|nr:MULTISPECIES: RHS repeat-associated core domain-containing protein [unclassified Bradyrhizobium]